MYSYCGAIYSQNNSLVVETSPKLFFTFYGHHLTTETLNLVILFVLFFALKIAAEFKRLLSVDLHFLDGFEQTVPFQSYVVWSCPVSNDK